MIIVYHRRPYVFEGNSFTEIFSCSQCMSELLKEGEEAPKGMYLANVIKHSESIIKSSIPALEWKNSTLYILDPFLLFYLRWDDNWKQEAIR